MSKKNGVYNYISIYWDGCDINTFYSNRQKSIIEVLLWMHGL